jgi:hypothetical protein
MFKTAIMTDQHVRRFCRILKTRYFKKKEAMRIQR